MQYLLLGALCGLVAGIPFDHGRDGWKVKWLVLTIGWGLISTFIAWIGLPQLVGPFWGGELWGMAFVGLALNFLWTFLGATNSSHNYGFSKAVCGILFLILVPTMGGLRSCGAWNATDYRAFVASDIETREWKVDMAAVNTAHIRMVSEEQAQWLAKKALGQSTDMGLGSRFKVGDVTIQKMGDQLVWIAPLEFQGFGAWQTADTSPGYVIVDAEDPNKPAVLKDGFKLRYLPSAYMGDNLERHLYENGYQFIGTTDYSFEVDDAGQPFYVVDVYKPTIGYYGEKILAVAVVDPQTGKITEYEPDQAPKWIDRIIPLEFAQDRLFDYGKYVHGWWNSVYGETDVNVPSVTHHKQKGTDKLKADALWLTWGDDGQAYWFAGLTSSKSTDDSLVGFVLMDSRTGHTREYHLPGGTDAVGVMEAVNSSVSNFKGWHATQPILYNIYGELTWAVPVISDTDIFQKLALVRASNTKVVLGDDKAQALQAYRQLLAQEGGNTEVPSPQAELQTATGQINRIACPVVSGNTICYLTLVQDQKKRVFSGTVEKSLFMTIARPGDQVTLSFIQTDSISVPIEKFVPIESDSPIAPVPATDVP